MNKTYSFSGSGKTKFHRMVEIDEPFGHKIKYCWANSCGQERMGGWTYQEEIRLHIFLMVEIPLHKTTMLLVN